MKEDDAKGRRGEKMRGLEGLKERQKSGRGF
jgi:hypothetical protein